MSLQYLADLETPDSSSHASAVLCVCWTERAVLSSDIRGILKAWNPDNALPFSPLPQAHENSVHNLTANRDTSRVLSSSIDGTLALWDLTAFPQGPTVSTRQEDTDVAAPVEDPAEQAAAPSPVPIPATVLLATSTTIASSAQGVSEAWSTVLHSTSPVFASVGIGARASLHSASPETFGELLFLSPPPTVDAASSSSSPSFGTKLAFDASGTLLAVGTSLGQVYLYQLRAAGTQPGRQDWSLTLLTTYADHALPVRALHFDEKDHLVVGSDDRTITIHDVRTQSRYDRDGTSRLNGTEGERQAAEVHLGGTVATLQGHKGWVMTVQSSPTAEGRIVASTSTDRTIKLWDLAVTPKMCVCTCTETDEVWSLDWKPASSRFDSGLHQQQQQQDSNGGSHIAAALGAATAATGVPSTSTGGLGQGSRFVTGGKDGKVRWYRSAGV